MSITNPLQHLINLLEEVKKRSWDIPAYKGESKNSKFLYLDPNDKSVRRASEAAANHLFDERGFVIRSGKHDLMRYQYDVIELKKAEGYGWETLGIYFIVEDYDDEDNKHLFHYIVLVENENILKTNKRFGVKGGN